MSNMWVLVITVVLQLILVNADPVEKRSYQPVEGAKIKEFTTQFRFALLLLIEREWEQTKLLVDRLNVTQYACKSRIDAMYAECTSCSTDECTPELQEDIFKLEDVILEQVALNFILGPLGWVKLTDFFEGAGKKFVDWSRLGKANDFFEDLAKGVVHWDGWKEIGDSLEDLGKGALDLGKDIGDGLKDLGDDVVDTLKDTGKKLEDGVKDLGKDLEDTVKDLGKGIENGVKDLGKGIENGVKNLGKGLENTVKDIGKGLENGVKGIGKSLGKIRLPKVSLPRVSLPRISLPRVSLPRVRFGRWGKKRRSLPYADDHLDSEQYLVLSDREQLDSEIRDCMEMCTSCDPFLVDDEIRIRLVCGSDFVQLRNVVQSKVSKISFLYDHTNDNQTPIVSSLEYNGNSYNFSDFSFADVQLTVLFKDGYNTYRSKFPFKTGETATSAALMAKEYYDQYMQR